MSVSLIYDKKPSKASESAYCFKKLMLKNGETITRGELSEKVFSNSTGSHTGLCYVFTNQKPQTSEHLSHAKDDTAENQKSIIRLFQTLINLWIDARDGVFGSSSSSHDKRDNRNSAFESLALCKLVIESLTFIISELNSKDALENHNMNGKQYIHIFRLISKHFIPHFPFTNHALNRDLETSIKLESINLSFAGMVVENNFYFESGDDRVVFFEVQKYICQIWKSSNCVNQRKHLFKSLKIAQKLIFMSLPDQSSTIMFPNLVKLLDDYTSCPDTDPEASREVLKIISEILLNNPNGVLKNDDEFNNDKIVINNYQKIEMEFLLGIPKRIFRELTTKKGTFICNYAKDLINFLSVVLKFTKSKTYFGSFIRSELRNVIPPLFQIKIAPNELGSFGPFMNLTFEIQKQILNIVYYLNDNSQNLMDPIVTVLNTCMLISKNFN